MIRCSPRSSWQVSTERCRRQAARGARTTREIAGIETNLEYLRQLVAAKTHLLAAA